MINLLKVNGFEVVETLPKTAESVNDSLKQRIECANNSDVDLFISIHFNSASNKNAEGIEIFYYDYNENLEKISNNIIDNFSKYEFENRGFKKANYYVLKNAAVPAILVECGFLSNINDMARYDAYKMAQNIFDGIMEGY